MAHLLVVDDEQSICWGLERLGVSLGHSVAVAASAEQGLAAIVQQRPDAILLDVRLPGMDGLTAMGHFRDRLGDVPLIIMTAYGELSTAIAAVRGGAFEYLVKPFDLALAQRTIERALSRPPTNAADKASLPSSGDANQIVGSSRAMHEVFRRLAVVAATDACVHLRGESGTGKEMVARAIHQYSRRVAAPFVAVNIASLSPTLAESELFGHVRGAFTGADQSRKGLLEQADGGTIFIDEVADIPMAIQVKLLRVLEYGDIVPVGGEKPVRSDFRIISATHQNLAQRVADGRFRADLYYRLITFELELPPLRDRQGDIPLLVEHFLDVLAAKNGCGRPVISAEALRLLETQPWYGNIRELRNAIEHALILSRGGPIAAEHLPPPTAPHGDPGQTREALLAAMICDWANGQLDQAPDATNLYERLLQLVERPLFAAVLNRHHGQYLAAARQLGLHRVTLKRKMEQQRPE